MVITVTPGAVYRGIGGGAGKGGKCGKCGNCTPPSALSTHHAEPSHCLGSCREGAPLDIWCLLLPPDLIEISPPSCPITHHAEPCHRLDCCDMKHLQSSPIIVELQLRCALPGRVLSLQGSPPRFAPLTMLNPAIALTAVVKLPLLASGLWPGRSVGRALCTICAASDSCSA